jgi:hypothetical protein
MKKKWMKWIVGVLSVSSFTGLVGVFQQDMPQSAAAQTQGNDRQPAEKVIGDNTNHSPVLDWDANGFDSPSAASRMIILDDEAIPFDDKVIAGTQQSSANIVRNDPGRESQPIATRKTRSHAS